MRYLYIFFFLLMQVCIVSAQDIYEVENDTTKTRTIGLEEISVISPKYSGNIFSLPTAVTAVPARIIENYRINSLPDISGVVPNFFMPDYGSKLTSPVYIRGIGTRINTPSVGLYVDGIPYFEKSAFNFDFFDLERIEVLRGPQGTLYGRNTMGGLINIFTAEPSFDRHSALKFSYENYNQINTTVLHNRPINDELSLMINLNQLHNDGFFTNRYNDKKADKLNSYSGRIKLLYVPSEKLRAQLNIQGETSKQGGYPYAIFNGETQSANDVNYNHPSLYNRNLISAGLNINYFAKNFKINWATGFQYLDDKQDIDQDFTENDLFNAQQWQEQYMIGQEISVQSYGNRMYGWLFGVFAFHQSMDKQVDVSSGSVPTETGFVKATDSKYYDNGNSGIAFFHNSELKFGDFILTAGIRIDYEKATLYYTHYSNADDYNELKIKDRWDSTLDFFEILPKVSVQYNCNNRLAPYITVAKGYNAGGFNSTIERDEDRSFKPEQSWNYELGFKGRFLQNRFFVNLALFHIDWRNQQIYQPVPSGQGSMLKNAGKSRSRGIELDARAIVFPNAEISATFGYNDAKFVEYRRSETLDYSGNHLPYVPQFTFSGSGNYTFNINNSKMLENIRLYLIYQGFGKHYWHEDNSAWQDYYGLLNCRITLINKNMELAFWGKNLLNSEYNSFYFTALNNKYVQLGKPLTFGADIKIKF